MSETYAKLTGDWPRFRYIINNLSPRLKIAIRAAARKNAKLLIREIKKGIKKQAPGGIVFDKLHELTVIEKARMRGIGFVKSNQALIRHGDLINLLTFEINSDGSFGVGYEKNATNSAGKNINMIASVMESGITIAVTDSVRGYFIAKGTPLKNSTTHLDIPARPFFEPVFNQFKDEIINNYIMAINSVIQGRPDLGVFLEGSDSVE